MFPQIFGKYVLEREIASGGMARVFLATLRGAGGFEKRLVVKQIRPELASDQAFVRRFVEEAKTTVELSHSNIVPVYELGVEQGTYYIAMEYCEGVSLTELLARGPLSPSEGAYVGVEICRALDYAHRRAGIIHRDVTPRNVMIDPEGMVRLIDFGIAASVDAVRAGEEALFGSPGHMPPEQLRRGPLTPAADVFAVGALLQESWTGRAPFRRESFAASQAALSEPPLDVALADAALAPLSKLVSSALALDPLARPQTAEELARPLRDFLRQTDLGDIARRLGERVSERLSLPAAQAASAAAPGRDRPSQSSGATQTFAVRDAVLEWTAKIDTRPGKASEPPNAHLIESGVIAPSEGAQAERDPADVRRFARLFSVAAAISVGLALLVVLAYVAGSARGNGRGEVTAAHDAAGNRALPGQTASPPLVPIASEPRPERAPSATLEAPAVPVVPAAAAGAALEDKPALRASTPLGRAAAVSSAVPSAPSPVSSLVSSPVVAGARVSVTSEPKALVTIDSNRMGSTPLLGVELTPGRHEIVFVNESLGERLQTSFSVQSREQRRVHADFTSAAPQVYVR